MTRGRRTLALAAMLTSWLEAPRALAQNYRELPIGGRTATMGGAATAAGNDSAMPYLNPAGLAGVPGDIFAISASVYGYTRRSIQDYFYPNGTDPLLGYELERETFAMSSLSELPSSVMYFNHLSDPKAHVHHHLGMSLVIPGRRQVDLVASVEGRLENIAGSAVETSSVQLESTRYYIGPSYAVGFGDRVRLGVSLYALYSRYVMADAASSSFSLLGGTTTIGYADQRSQIADSVSATAIAGIQIQLFRNFWGGVGLAAPSLPITGRMRFAANSNSTLADPISGDAQASSTTTTGDLEYESNEPFRANVGLAYDNREAFSLAADLIFYAGRRTSSAKGVKSTEQTLSGDVTRRYNTSQDISTTADAVFNFSLGSEVALSKLFSLRAGAFSDVAASPEIGADFEEAGRLRLDRYGGTLGLGLKVGSFDTTLGTVLARGTGEYGAADTSITSSVVAVPATETTAMVILSGAVTVEEAKKAISDTLPFQAPILPDLGHGSGAAPIPRVPTPLPPERRPPPPALRSQPQRPPVAPDPTLAPPAPVSPGPGQPPPAATPGSPPPSPEPFPRPVPAPPGGTP